MKTHMGLLWVSVVIASLFAGCQEMSLQSDYKPTGSVAKESVKTARTGTPKLEYKVSWVESCSVQQANTASLQVLKVLRLDAGTSRTRTVETHNPETGKRVTRQVPIHREPEMDSLSGVVETQSASGIEFRIEMLLQYSNPEITQISIIATSSDHSTNELRDQSRILQQKISEGIQNPSLKAVGKSIPYPETVMVACDVETLYDILYNWAGNMGFDLQSMRGDTFYKGFTFRTGSGVGFKLVMRNIESNKTKLEIGIEDHQDKEEFPMILKSFHETLQSIKTL